MKRVAVIPLKQFLDARSDSELVAKLAASVERAAVLKYLRREAATIELRDGVAAHLLVMANAIESGAHV